MSLIRLENVSKHFGAVHALDDVSLEIGPGEVVGLMGDNGAGKSTLVKIMAGNYRPTAGSYFIEGERVQLGNPAEARSRGASDRVVFLIAGHHSPPRSEDARLLARADHEALP